MMTKLGPRIGLLGAALLVAGCATGSNATPVSGKLTWEDGKPVNGATVRFVPAGQGGREASGYTGKDGTYSLSSYKQGDGAEPGDYTVVVTKAAEAPAPDALPKAGSSPEEMAKAMKGFDAKRKGATGAKVVDPIPQVYTSEKSSPLKFTVPSGGTSSADFKLTKS